MSKLDIIQPWTANLLVGVWFDDLNEISTTILHASQLLDDRIVDAEIAVLVRKIQAYAQKMICYAEAVGVDEPE
jgi:hypothetical protein